MIICFVDIGGIFYQNIYRVLYLSEYYILKMRRLTKRFISLKVLTCSKTDVMHCKFRWNNLCL